MDDLKLLLDDHALLSSSVIHVVALIRRFAAGRFEAAALDVELERQLELLREQLVHHFDFEETTSFPRLEEHFAAFAAELRGFAVQHDGILQLFDLIRTEMSFATASTDRRSLQKRALAFEREFEAHATAETKLFNELAASLVHSRAATGR